MSDDPAPEAPASPLPGCPEADAGASGGRTADDLQGTVMQVIADLAGIAGWLPCASPEDADRGALLLTALAAECTEAAGMCRAIGSGKRSQ